MKFYFKSLFNLLREKLHFEVDKICSLRAAWKQHCLKMAGFVMLKL